MPKSIMLYKILLNHSKDELIGCTNDGNIIIWNLKTFKIKHKFINHTNHIY